MIKVVHFLLTVPLLTPNNVLEAVQGVKKLWGMGSLALYLDIPRFKQNEIQQKYHTVEDQLRELVKYWIQAGFQVSWRTPIWSLDCVGETSAADKIRKFAEPLRGE